MHVIHVIFRRPESWSLCVCDPFFIVEETEAPRGEGTSGWTLGGEEGSEGFVGGGLTSTEEGNWALQQPRGGISHNLLRLTACTPSHKAQGEGSIPQPCPQPLRDFTNSDCANFIQSVDAPEPWCQSFSRGTHFLCFFGLTTWPLRSWFPDGIKPMPTPPHPSPPTGMAES